MTSNLYTLISDVWADLLEAKKQEDKKRFDEIMLSVIPELRHYIARRLKVSLNKGKLPKNKYSVEDFLAQIYIDAYDNINNFSDVQTFVNWLFIKADDLLEETISDEEFKTTFFDDYDKFSKEELDTMEERYSIDGGGHLMMLEEFDDPSYKTNLFPNYEYSLDNVFIDKDEDKKLIEKLNKELTPEQIDKHIKLVVNELPIDERVIFELSTINGLDNEHIAEIRKIDITEVDEKLNIVKRRITETLVKRYNL